MQNILIIGGGGREHAIAAKLKESGEVGDLYCIPGNAGIAEIATCKYDISVTDFNRIYEFINSSDGIDMVVVAPDDPLAKGLVDYLEERGIRAFGPSRAAAQLEASKSFAKDFMKRHNIPTAGYAVFTEFKEALKYVKTQPHPIVIKADGLAYGKGVIISKTPNESATALRGLMREANFGAAGTTVVIEEFMTGKEVSLLTFCDGKTIVPMVSSQDHKRAYDNDEGLNTGGMGSFSPSVAYTAEVEKDFTENIMKPTLKGLIEDGIKFKGVLYFGLMITDEGVKVVEFNARFGDPETQVVLPRLKTDLLQIFDAIIDEKLSDIKIEWSDDAAVCVVLTAEGYPVAYEKGMPIKIEKLPKGVTLYHAGTRNYGGELVTSGGRVIGVCAKGPTIEDARVLAYKGVTKVYFDQRHFRTDIGKNL